MHLATDPGKLLGQEPPTGPRLQRDLETLTLPHAFVHPDFVAANALPTPDTRLIIVDWAGSGRGPRLWSLGFALFAAGARSPKLIDPLLSRYARHVRLEPEELERLKVAIRAGR